MSQAEVAKFVEVEVTGPAVIEKAWASFRELSHRLGVPSLDEMMREIEGRVLKEHGPAPDTPTWEDVVAAWTQHQAEADDAALGITDAEIVDEPLKAPAKAKLPVKARNRKPARR